MNYWTSIVINNILKNISIINKSDILNGSVNETFEYSIENEKIINLSNMKFIEYAKLKITKFFYNLLRQVQ